MAEINDLKLLDLNIPIGLCEIQLGDTIFPAIGSEGVFQAIPKYKVIRGGGLNEIQGYILEQYDVTFEVAFPHEHMDIMRFYLPTLQRDDNGHYDSPQKVDTSTNKLIIHPYISGDNKEFDICIWNAYIDPENSYKKVFGKQTNKFNVRFIAKMAKNHSVTKLVNSYFYIGDWSKVGVPSA